MPTSCSTRPSDTLPGSSRPFDKWWLYVVVGMMWYALLPYLPYDWVWAIVVFFAANKLTLTGLTELYVGEACPCVATATYKLRYGTVIMLGCFLHGAQYM